MFTAGHGPRPVALGVQLDPGIEGCGWRRQDNFQDEATVNESHLGSYT